MLLFAPIIWNSQFAKGVHRVNQKVTLDSTDVAIIQCVSKNGRLSYVEIANHTGVSEATVRNRIQRLTETDVLNFIGVVDPFRTGLYVVAMIALKVDVCHLDEACISLSKYSEIRFVVACAGTFNIMIEVVAGSTEEMLDFVAKNLPLVPGVSQIEVSQELKLYKNAFNYL